MLMKLICLCKLILVVAASETSTGYYTYISHISSATSGVILSAEETQHATDLQIY